MLPFFLTTAVDQSFPYAWGGAAMTSVSFTGWKGLAIKLPPEAKQICYEMLNKNLRQLDAGAL